MGAEIGSLSGQVVDAEISEMMDTIEEEGDVGDDDPNVRGQQGSDDQTGEGEDGSGADLSQGEGEEGTGGEGEGEGEGAGEGEGEGEGAEGGEGTTESQLVTELRTEMRLMREEMRAGRNGSTEGDGTGEGEGESEDGMTEEEASAGSEYELEAEDFVSEEDYETAMGSHEGFNKVLNKVLSSAVAHGIKVATNVSNKKVEFLMRKTPAMIQRELNNRDAVRPLITKFFADNPEFKENKDFIDFVSAKVKEEHPDLSMKDHLSMVKKRASKTLPSTGGEGRRTNNGRRRRGAAAGRNAGSGNTETKSEEEKEIAEMMNL